MAFHNSYSFSHRFTGSDSGSISDLSTWSEINHQSNGETTTALVNDFYFFLLGCGFSPASVVSAMIQAAEEYGTAHCREEGALVWNKREGGCGASCSEQHSI